MGFRFRRSISVLPGIRMNLSRRGVSSFTVGRRGSSINVGKRGAFLNLGLPGSGVSYPQRLSLPKLIAPWRREILREPFDAKCRKTAFDEITNRSEFDAPAFICPQCSQPISAANHFCGECGFAVTAHEIVRAFYGNDKRVDRKSWDFAICGGVTVFLAALSLIVLLAMLAAQSKSLASRSDSVSPAPPVSPMFGEGRSAPSTAHAKALTGGSVALASAIQADEYSVQKTGDDVSLSVRIVPVFGSASEATSIGSGPMSQETNAQYYDLVKGRLSAVSISKEVGSGGEQSSGALVRFMILSNGFLQNSHIAQTSGSLALDQECLRRLQLIDKFPQLPAGIEKLFVSFNCNSAGQSDLTNLDASQP